MTKGKTTERPTITMYTKDVARAASGQTGYTISSCEEIIKAAFDAMADELVAHGCIFIANFGTFEIQKLKDARFDLVDIDSLTTGERKSVVLSDRKRIKYRPIAALKRKVKET